MTLEEMMMQIAGGQQQEQTPRKIHPEAVMMELQQAASRYEEGCTFQVGDVVTAVESSFSRIRGPAIVVEVYDPPIRLDEISDPTDCGSPAFGARIDIRVVCWNEDVQCVVAHSIESWMFRRHETPESAE